MNTSKTQAKLGASKVARITMAIALASAVGGLGMTPSVAEVRDNHGHDARDRGHKSVPVRHDYRPERYRSSYYAPPPVYYAPQSSPGISLFIPINIH